MRQDWRDVGSYGTVGLEIVLSLLLGLLIGRWIDGKLGTSPVFSVIWFGFGVAAGVKAVMRALRQLREDAAREEREQGNPAPLIDDRDEDDREEERRHER